MENEETEKEIIKRLNDFADALKKDPGLIDSLRAAAKNLIDDPEKEDPLRCLGARRHKDWPKKRSEFIKRMPYCAACGRSDDLEVHHILPFHLYPVLELDDDNLITLCADPCHIVFGHLGNFMSYNRDCKADCWSYLQKVKNRPAV